MVALDIKRTQFDWTADFIQQQKVYLKADQRDSLVNFNQAQLFYAQGKLSQAAQYLIKVSTRQPFLYLGAKSLLLKVLYEAKEWDALDSALKSLRVYLQRRKGLGYRAMHYQLLLRFFKQLIQLKPSDKKARKELRAAVAEADAFRTKEWFYGWV